MLVAFRSERITKKLSVKKFNTGCYQLHTDILTMSQIFYTQNPLTSKIQIIYDNKPEEKSYSSNIRDTVIKKKMSIM